MGTNIAKMLGMGMLAITAVASNVEANKTISQGTIAFVNTNANTQKLREIADSVRLSVYGPEKPLTRENFDSANTAGIFFTCVDKNGKEVSGTTGIIDSHGNSIKNPTRRLIDDSFVHFVSVKLSQDSIMSKKIKQLIKQALGL